MLHLPNNCRAGKFSVSPRNWKSPAAKVNCIWSISYWFYDDNLNKKKKIVVKGMNQLTNLPQKQAMTKALLEEVREEMEVLGYNHITGTYTAAISAEISSYTPVNEALQYALSKLKVECIADVRHCFEYCKGVISRLGYSRVSIKEINSMHITLVLERVAEEKKQWSASSHNHYRSYLFMLFKRLVKMLVIPTNPVRDVEKRKETRLVRETLGKSERTGVRLYLQKHDPDFWPFTHIFFHSGSRETELLNLKPADVDLENGRFKVLVKKGGFREEWRPIKDIVFAEWQKVLSAAKPDDYLFSKRLKPGPVKINPIQVSKRWRRVKKALGITADFYAFKHSNLDEMAAALKPHNDAMKKTAEIAGHSAIVVTMRYAQGEKDRQNDTVKKVWNEF